MFQSFGSFPTHILIQKLLSSLAAMSIEGGPPLDQAPFSQKKVGGMVCLTPGTPMYVQIRPPFPQGRAKESIVIVELLWATVQIRHVRQQRWLVHRIVSVVLAKHEVFHSTISLLASAVGIRRLIRGHSKCPHNVPSRSRKLLGESADLWHAATTDPAV